MTLVHALLAGAAGWRLASLLVQEMGPASIFHRLRQWAGVSPRLGDRPRPRRKWLAGVLSCVWCCSVWTTAAMWLVGWAVSWSLVGIVAATCIGPMLDMMNQRARS